QRQAGRRRHAGRVARPDRKRAGEPGRRVPGDRGTGSRGRMSQARSLAWFARHEARLSWRDTLSMMTAGRPDRERRVIFWILSFALFLHGIAYLVLQRYVGPNIHVDAKTLIAVTSAILLSGSAMLSQAMESITRIFYSRSDLELILSAPARADKLFAVRIGAMAFSATLVSVFLIGPFIDILIWRSSLRWIGA